METNAAPRFPWLAITALAVAVALGAGWLHVTWRDQLLDAARAEILAVADLKAGQIAAWRAERLEDGRVMLGGPLVAVAAGAALSGRTQAAGAVGIDAFLRSVASHGAYSEALLVDASGQVLAFANRRGGPVDPATAEVQEALRSREIQVAEICRHAGDDPPHLHLVVPILEGGRLRGGLALRMEAAQYLYPLLSSWAGGRPGTETSLVRRDGDAVQFLNPPLGSAAADLAARAPLTARHLPAVRAALGEEGLVEGRDRRGVPVLAALRTVRGSSWHVVTKVDRAAVLGPLQGRTWATGLVAALLVGGMGLMVGARFRRQQALFAARHEALEAQLRIRQLDLLVRSADDLVFLCGDDLRFLDVNDRVTALYGYTVEEMRGLTAGDLRVGGARADAASMKDLAGRAEGLVFEAVHRRKDGSTFPVEVRARSMVVDGRRYFTGVIRDLSERQRVAAAHAYQAMLLDRLDDAVVGSSPDYIITAWNRAAERLYGYPAEEALGRSAPALLQTEVLDPERPALADRLQAGGSTVARLRQRRRDGSIVEVDSTLVALRDASGAVTGYVGVNRDFTRLGRAEEQQAAAERLAALGTLAGGVAHEVNNPLAYVAADIRSAAQAIREHAQVCRAARTLEDAEAALAEADIGTRQIAVVVRDLQTFARARGESRGLVDVRSAARSAAALAHNTVRHRATLKLDLGEAPMIEADAQDLTQVLLRLLLHSAHSIPEGRAADNQVRVVTAGQAGGAVVEIRDTGSRPAAGHDAPGLEAARTAVAAMGGALEVVPLGGRGTCYRITLEAGRSAAAAPPAPAAPPSAPGPPREPARRGRILVVDDEPLVGRAVARLLGSAHEVVVESDGRAAEARLLAGERFDLVLCDLMMPDVTGMELHDRLHASRPDEAARLVFMTGGAFTERAREFLDRTRAPCVEKPFDMERLRALVAERIGSRG